MRPLPWWQNAGMWFGLTGGILFPPAWIPALFSYNNWSAGRTRQPTWAIVYGLATAALWLGAIGAKIITG